MSYTNGKKLFNFKLIGIGLIFLLDFNVNTVDILPDFIALVFISAGIGRTWYISERLSKVRNYIKIFFVFSLLKFICNMIYMLVGSEIFDNSLILLLTTLFSGTELVLSILMFSDIFKGLESFFQQSDRMVHTNSSDNMLKLIKFFIIAKFVMAMIVQIPVVLTDVTWDNLSMIFDVYLDADFAKKSLIPPCFIIQTLLGILVLSVVLPFFFNVGKDKNLYDFVKSKINRTMISDNFFALKQALNFSFLLFMTGCVFFIDLQIDNINFLPDFMICIFFLLGIFTVTRANPEIKNKKLNIYLALNLFVSLFSYISGTIYRIKSASAFIGEDVIVLNILRLSYDISFHISVIIFFLIFIEFYSFIKNLQRKHLEFSVKYLNKYMTLSEKNFDKNRNKVLTLAAAVFCVKTLSAILPVSGLLMFVHSLVLITFTVFVARGLYTTRDAVYSYYIT